MKKVFSNSYDVVHVFAQQTQKEGRNQTQSIFFNDNKLYSYGYHYLLCEFLDNETVLINNEGYSVTTSKHIHLISDATSHKKQFFKKSTDIKIVKKTIKEYLNKLPRSRQNKQYYLNEIFGLYNSLNEYLKYTKTKTKVSKTKEYKEIFKIVQGLKNNKETILLQVKEIQKNNNEKLKKKILQSISDFKSYEINYINNAKKCYLRISKDNNNIETSKGVKIEINKAKLLYKLIQAKKDIKGFKLDYYTVIGIVNNTLRIGCHDIPMQEVETISKHF